MPKRHVAGIDSPDKVKMLPALSWQCLITVSDNGEGILPEVQDKIFLYRSSPPSLPVRASGSVYVNK